MTFIKRKCDTYKAVLKMIVMAPYKKGGVFYIGVSTTKELIEDLEYIGGFAGRSCKYKIEDVRPGYTFVFKYFTFIVI